MGRRGPAGKPSVASGSLTGNSWMVVPRLVVRDAPAPPSSPASPPRPPVFRAPFAVRKPQAPARGIRGATSCGAAVPIRLRSVLPSLALRASFGSACPSHTAPHAASAGRREPGGASSRPAGSTLAAAATAQAKTGRMPVFCVKTAWPGSREADGRMPSPAARGNLGLPRSRSIASGPEGRVGTSRRRPAQARSAGRRAVP